jgi:hypothetical protein
LLRPRHERPCRRATEPCDEFASSHLQSSRFKIDAVELNFNTPPVVCV